MLMAIPGPPMFEQETVDQIHALMDKGVAATVFLATDDCRASFDELKGRGVEFIEEPEERPVRHRRGVPRPVRQSPAADAGDDGRGLTDCVPGSGRCHGTAVGPRAHASPSK